MSYFARKVAVVTGGASGIGRALVHALTERGARVVVADIDDDGAAAVATETADHPGEATPVHLDVTDPDAFERVIADTVERHRRVDLLFNNAGIAVAGETRDHTHEDWRRVLDVDLWGVIHGVRAVYPVMIRQRSGHIINTASIAGLFPIPGFSAYAAAKHGVVGLTHALRAEAAPLGVRVSALCPAVIRTAIFERAEVRGVDDRDVAIQAYLKGMPVGRPEQVARAALRGVVKNKNLILPREARFYWYVWRWWPSLMWWRIGGVARSLQALRNDPS